MNYCINRDDRPERWADVSKEFARMNIEVARYSAKIDKIGWRGCRDSHLSCIIAINAEEEDGIIFEDDVVFLCNKHDYNFLYWQVMEELPSDWDILYFGASPQSPQSRYSEHLYRLTNAFCTHAMMWNARGRAIDAIIEADTKYEIGKIDVFLRDKILPNFNCFITSPMICSQRQYKSDTCGRSDVSTIVKNYNLYCK